MTHEEGFEEARKSAVLALCTRDKCGAVIVKDGVVIGRGYNAPPSDDMASCKCHLELPLSRKPKSDRTCCMHAEWRAVLNALMLGNNLEGSTLYFTRVDKENGDILPAKGEPYCTVCSRLALDTGVSFFALITKDGPLVFDTKKYNDVSYNFHALSNGGVLPEEANERKADHTNDDKDRND